MRTHAPQVLTGIAITLLMGLFLFSSVVSTLAATSSRLIPIRTYVAVAHHWQFRYWESNDVACDLFIDGEDAPAHAEVRGSCGDLLYQEWLETPLCIPAITQGDTTECRGVYLQALGVRLHNVTEWQELPEPTIDIQLVNCLPGFWCGSRPRMQFSASEPLQGYHIEAIRVEFGDHEALCEGDQCEIRLPLTDEKGVTMRVSALSSYGDESTPVEVIVRNLVTNEGSVNFRFDLLGEQWADQAPSCSVVWDSFPSIDDEIAWLLPVNSPDDLYTNTQFAYLAGDLIWTGKVAAATQCSNQGLVGHQSANLCGQDAARVEVIAAQNRFNAKLYQVGEELNMPARVLKGIIAQESQFIPESNEGFEYGYGRLTENGLDMLLTWNTEYFLDICTSVLSSLECSSGYNSLSPGDQAIMRGLVSKSIGTQDEIALIGHTVAASCEQTGQIIRNTTGFRPGSLVSYQNLWRITIGVYHYGSGCVNDAITRLWALGGTMLTWDQIHQHLDPTCFSADTDYVDRVIYYSP